ncbi:hypothetical protein [Polaribacter sp. SA4-10]|uniref:hypothetical protein n=1 Tax=Polaribacter sp. SA4-10 TaxID=754397 RepID=UPI0012F98F20|nr:hypothetical protein [Polaribacter sp. SA4-10]
MIFYHPVAYEVLTSENSSYKSLVNEVNGLTYFRAIDSQKNIDKILAALITYMVVARDL